MSFLDDCRGGGGDNKEGPRSNNLSCERVESANSHGVAGIKLLFKLDL